MLNKRTQRAENRYEDGCEWFKTLDFCDLHAELLVKLTIKLAISKYGSVNYLKHAYLRKGNLEFTDTNTRAFSTPRHRNTEAVRGRGQPTTTSHGHILNLR